MTKFYEGQEVEVHVIMQEAYAGFKERRRWRKAKVIGRGGGIQSRLKPDDYEVEFPDGSCGVVTEDHIRSADSSDKDRFKLKGKYAVRP